MLNEIYNLINGYEINAQEVHGGLTFIDSCEAEDLTKKIITIIRDEMSFNINIGVDNYTCSACDDNLTKLNKRL